MQKGYLTTNGKNLVMNGNRDRTESNLNKIRRYASAKLSKLYMEFDECRHEAGVHGQTSYIVNADITKILRCILFYQRIEYRAAIYWDDRVIKKLAYNKELNIE